MGLFCGENANFGEKFVMIISHYWRWCFCKLLFFK